MEAKEKYDVAIKAVYRFSTTVRLILKGMKIKKYFTKKDLTHYR